jgi:RHS repeat-associated protein
MKQAGSAATNDIATTLYNVYADHIDTPRIITKQDHAIVWRWDSAEAFGATAPNENPGGTGTFSYNPRFPGQVFDVETGLNQNWHREYNARLGRYIEPDPLGLMSQPALASRLSPKLRAKLTKMQSLNHLYSYVDGDPLNKSDPEGLEPAAAMSVAPLAGRGAGALLGGLRGAPGGVVGIALGIGVGVLAEGACEPSDRDRRERQCDADYDAGQKFCHAMAVTKGRHKRTKKYAETYSQCMRAVDEAYVECYQEAGKP